MSFWRVVRIIFGIILAAIFAAVVYLHSANWIKSKDLDPLIEEAEPAVTDTAVTEPVIGDAVVFSEPEPTLEPTPEPTVDPDSPAGRAAALGLPAPPDIDITSWEFILANADNSIAEYAPPSLVTLGTNGQTFDSRIQEPLMNMVNAANAEGLSTFLSSGYRSYSDQQANFRRVCENNGVSDGKDYRGFYITMPAGCSEHQTGLACDITDIYYPIKNSSIENTETFQYLKEHCWEYGFILRFPADKEEITGVMYEPFHFRYVGEEVARYITENGLCYEEFYALYV